MIQYACVLTSSVCVVYPRCHLQESDWVKRLQLQDACGRWRDIIWERSGDVVVVTRNFDPGHARAILSKLKGNTLTEHNISAVCRMVLSGSQVIHIGDPIPYREVAVEESYLVLVPFVLLFLAWMYTLSW